MLRIRDPLHGTVALGELEGQLLDSLPMQRLRGVRQLAMAYLVYPGANHTRFEHSIGTLALSSMICKELGLGIEETSKVRLSALLHDVGHSAFSHEAEHVLSSHIGNHEEIGQRLVEKSPISDILGENYSPREIASLYKTPLGQIIASDVGADRMDYLLRDSHYTGVAYGIVDAQRIAQSLSMGKEGLLLSERGLEAAESLLVARFTMFTTVYMHKTVRIASRMLQQSISLAIGGGEFEPSNALALSDSQMLDALAKSKSGGKFAIGLKERKLFKKAFSFPPSKLAMDQKQFEEKLSQECGASVLLDIPHLSFEASTKVISKGRETNLSEASELISSLRQMQHSRLEALVICEEKNVKRVEEAARRLFQK